MRTDHLTYRMATRVSLFGFVLQLLMGLVVLIFGINVGDDVTRMAAIYMLTGPIVWAALVFLFIQHKLERIEAIEAEQLAGQAGRAGSIFDIADEDLNVAARRLRWMHRYLVPFVSLVMVAALLLLGFWMRSTLNALLYPPQGIASQLGTADSTLAAWGMAVTAGIAVICFIFSRYVSGMSQMEPWKNLRGGASVVVGTAIFSAALAFGHGFLISGNDTVMRALAVVLPIAVILLGLEIAANFLLNIYRPRRPGELPRPAFDSRVLSMAAAPDTIAKSVSDAINYQFGFQVTTTWFYQLVSRQVMPLFGFCLALLVMLNCVAVVRPYEMGFVTTFGEVSRGGHVFDSGLVFKFPWQRIELYPVHRVLHVTIGEELDEDTEAILWGASHTAEPEGLIIVGPEESDNARSAAGEGSDVVARNYSVLNAMVPIQYQIKTGEDPDGTPHLFHYINFVGGDDTRRAELIREMGARVLTRLSVRTRINDLLGAGRTTLAHDLRLGLQRELDAVNDGRGAGIAVLFVGVAGIHPPQEVADSFEEVLQAQQEEQAKTQEAQGERITILAGAAGNSQHAAEIVRQIEALNLLGDDDDEARARQLRVIEDLLVRAGGDAARQLLRARAFRWARHMGAWSEMLRINSRSLPFQEAKSYYKHHEYLKRLQTALAGARTIITAANVDTHVTVMLDEDPTVLDMSGGFESLGIGESER